MVNSTEITLVVSQGDNQVTVKVTIEAGQDIRAMFVDTRTLLQVASSGKPMEVLSRHDKAKRTRVIPGNAVSVAQATRPALRLVA